MKMNKKQYFVLKPLFSQGKTIMLNNFKTHHSIVGLVRLGETVNESTNRHNLKPTQISNRQ